MDTGRLLLSLLITSAVSAEVGFSVALVSGRCVLVSWLPCRLMDGRIRSPGDVCTPTLHGRPHRPPARGTPSAGTGLVGSATLLPMLHYRLAQPPEELNGIEASGDISQRQPDYIQWKAAMFPAFVYPDESSVFLSRCGRVCM